jgi:hypothetical protein
MEDWMVNVKIEPQVWTKRNTGKSKRYVFSKVLVHLVITDSRGKMTADFESYLNCSLKDCDRDTPQTSSSGITQEKNGQITLERSSMEILP